MPGLLQKAGIFMRMGRAVCLSLAAGLCAAVLSATAFAGECGGIRDNVLRLHVVANSDSEEDQRLKLLVRDSVLSSFPASSSLEEAMEQADASLPLLEEAAVRTLREQGCDDPVRAELVRVYFPTREYEDLTLPAGEYDAVRLTIGEGKGHNWWCVLYPPLCLPAAEGEEALADVLNETQTEIISGGEKYRFSFALVELWENLKENAGG